MKNSHLSEEYVGPLLTGGAPVLKHLESAGRSSVAKGANKTEKLGLYRHYFKRPLELILVLMVAPILLPVFLLVIVLTVLSGNHVFYKQKRIGRNGVAFTIWKFCTMVPDADSKLAAYLSQDPAAADEWHRNQKLADDPRITPFGRFLRKYSIDELPQLINVVNGTMSLIGPRPIMVDQQELYPGEAYYEMRPGVTGYWQVSERNECSFRERASYDNQYWQNLSLLTDVKIVFSTIFVVFRGTGL